MWSRKRQDAVPAGESISANITGPVSGQVAVGKHIEQHQAITGAPVSHEELAQLRAAFTDLAAHVAALAPPGQHAAAVERVSPT
jgi:stress response protein YsnF